MAQLRNFQFLRNSTISSFANYAAARTAAISAFNGITTLLDGEIALYSYKLDGDATTVHTLLGIKRTNGIEIVANYDELTAEYQSYVNTQIQALDSTKTSTNNGVTVTVTQVDGKIDSVSVVAPSLGDAIAALDVDPFSLTTLNGDKLEGYQISEVDGKIVKGTTPETLLTFASAPTATNKVVTQAEITALNADKTSTNGTNVQVQVIETAGVITGVNVTTDNTVNATDVNNAITTAIAGLESEVENETGDIKVKVKQVNGVLTAVTVTDSLAAVAHSGAAADVTVAAGIEGLDATNVQAALAELAGDIAVLDAAQLEAGKGIDIDGTTINADLKLSIDNETTGEGESQVTTTYLYIKDTEGNEISKVNANAFVKDGFLQKVEKDATNNTLVFTWNTDAGIEKTTIAISDLCDVYTADETYLHLNGYKFEHKEPHTAEKTVGEITIGATADNSATVEKANDEISFKVPTLTIDKAGHVKELDEYKVNITLPASIGTAIQSGAGVNTTYIQTNVARNATNTNQLDVTVTAKIGDYAAEGQVDGLATTIATKTYVDGQIEVLDDKIEALDDSITTVTKGTGISVTDAGTGNDHAYTVALAEAKATVTENTDDYVAAEGTHTRISDITVDDYGRVTAVTKTTVTENFDMGVYD